MRFAILSRNHNLHSVRRLLQEARKRGIDCDVINPLRCQIVLEGNRSRIVSAIAGRPGAQALPRYDAVLPRIGASITAYGLAVVRHFEALGSRCINPASAIEDSRDKLRCLQILTQAKIPVPNTILLRSQKGLDGFVPTLGGMPVVLKLLEGTQGLGVMIVHSSVSLSSALDTLHGLGHDALLQQFIAEGAGRDIRAFVVGRKVVAAMVRTAAKGEFRSNIHRGGKAQSIKLPPKIQKVAVHAAAELGLEVAGVDLMEGRQGPLVLEVNSSPGFEGIEQATGVNVAGEIMDWMKKRAGDRKRA